MSCAQPAIEGSEYRRCQLLLLAALLIRPSIRIDSLRLQLQVFLCFISDTIYTKHLQGWQAVVACIWQLRLRNDHAIE